MKQQLILKLIFMSILGSGFIMGFNMLTPSMLTDFFSHDIRQNKALVQAYEEHVSTVPCIKRIMVSKVIKSLVTYSNIPKWNAIFLTQFFYLILAISALLLLNQQTNAPNEHGVLYGFLFMFSNLFMFHSPIYSYDEGAMYFFTFLALLLYRSKYNAWTPVAVFLCLLSREAALLVFPGVAIYFLLEYGWKEGIRKILYHQILPLSFYAHHLNQFTVHDVDRGDLLSENFRSARMIMNWVVGFFIVSAIPLAYYWKNFAAMNARTRNWFVCFAISVVVNAVAVIAGTKVKEVRYFSFPVLMLLPFAGTFLKELLPLLKESFGFWNRKKLAFFAGLSLALYHLYFPIDAKFGLGFRIYFILYTILFLHYVNLFPFRAYSAEEEDEDETVEFSHS